MNSQSYDEKRHELEDSNAFGSFAISAGLVGFALMLVQAIL